MTDGIIHLTRSSNVGINGRWVFRVDGAHFQMPNAVFYPGRIHCIVSMSLMRVASLTSVGLIIKKIIYYDNAQNNAQIVCARQATETSSNENRAKLIESSKLQLSSCYFGWALRWACGTQNLKFYLSVCPLHKCAN